MKKKLRNWLLSTSLVALSSTGIATANDNTKEAQQLEQTQTTSVQAEFNQKAENKLYISKKTRDLVGEKWSDKMTEWAGKNLFIISARGPKRHQTFLPPIQKPYASYIWHGQP